jgi:hypothetical protein
VEVASHLLARPDFRGGRGTYFDWQRGDVAKGETPRPLSAAGGGAGEAGCSVGGSGGDPHQGLLRSIPNGACRGLKEKLGYGDTERMSVYRHRGRHQPLQDDEGEPGNATMLQEGIYRIITT